MIRSSFFAIPTAKLAIATTGLLTLTAGPGHATTITPLPGPPAAALIAGAAVVAALVIARVWRRK